MLKSVVNLYFLQPFRLSKYLSKEKQVWPVTFSREYYLSFEDALWDLLPRLGYKKGATFLVPSFYCVDVINNITAHGYLVKSYEVNRDLTISLETVGNAITQYKPDIFIDFDAVGIDSGISTFISRKLPFSTLIVKDKVHTVVGASIENFPESDRHLLLTSTRKVTPFPGSLAIYTRNARNSSQRIPLKYTLKALTLWIIYIIFLKIAYIFRSKDFMKLSEKVLKIHDDLIGDAMFSAPLSKKWLYLVDHIAVDTIKSTKERQFLLYMNAFESFLISNKLVWTHPNVSDNSKNLRGFPLILNINIASSVIAKLRQNGVFITSQLDDSQWSQSQKLIILPMGPHLKDRDIEKVAKITVKALTDATQYDTITA